MKKELQENYSKLKRENSALKHELEELKKELSSINNNRFSSSGLYHTKVGDVYYEADLDGNILDISPSIKYYSHFSREELIGTQISSIYTNPQDREVFVENLMNNGFVEDYIINLTDPKKKERRISVNARIHLNDENKPTKITGVLKDITEIEKMNKDLRWLRRAINHSPVSIVITDTEGNIEFSNPFFTEATGYTKEEVLGKNPSLLKSGEQGLDFYKNLWETIKSGNTWEGEFHNKKKDGTLFWEKATIAPVKNKKGEIVSFIAIKEDITKQKTDAEEIQRLKAFNDRIITTMREGIIVEDADGNIIYSNPSFKRMCQYRFRELIGSNWELLIDKKHKETVIAANKRRLKNISDSYEVEIKRKDGTPMPVLVSGTPIIENDKYKGLIAVFTDISQLKENEIKLENALEQAKLADKLKSSFLANMSHEIRTPMNAILGFSEILRQEKDLEDKLREEYFIIIEEKGKELLQIISDIIDISKIESKILTIRPKEILLKEFFDNIYSSFYRELEQDGKNIKFKLSIPDDSSLIITDQYRLNQVVTNLLNNAKKFTNEGEIEFGYEKIGTTYKFFVRDTGIGISEENLKIVFERFRQADDNYTRSFGGTGLGLNICKNLVELLGGKIYVQSKAGEGSIFYFIVPESI